jgi:acetate kinase
VTSTPQKSRSHGAVGAILVLNAGSSSIKFSLFPASRRPERNGLLCEGACRGIGHRIHFAAKDGAGAPLVSKDLEEAVSHQDALASILRWLASCFPDHSPVAAGHRVVHGGSRYSEPIAIDEKVTAELRRLIPLAPLHQPHPLTAIETLSKLHPNLPQVACFDTAFHHTQPRVAAEFALPRKLTEEGIRRYGFHGLSYEYIASVLPEVIGIQQAQGRVVVAHLGNGASMCALKAGRSVATTMGFTALDGLPMSRRCGSLDPGVLLYLISEKGMSTEAVSDLLYNASGLLGVSGISDDMKSLLESEQAGAAEAVDLFVYRIGRELGSLAAALGGLDAVVFTAGIGEHAPEIRRRVCQQAAWLGVELDEDANLAGGPRITRPASPVSAWAIATDEDLMIARHTFDLCAQRQLIGSAPMDAVSGQEVRT